MWRSNDCRFAHQPSHTVDTLASAGICCDPRNIDYAALTGVIRIRMPFSRIKPKKQAVPRKMQEENNTQFAHQPTFSGVAAQDFLLTRQHPRNLKYIPVG
jgi:hypothetical protein